MDSRNGNSLFQKLRNTWGSWKNKKKWKKIRQTVCTNSYVTIYENQKCNGVVFKFLLLFQGPTATTSTEAATSRKDTSKKGRLIGLG